MIAFQALCHPSHHPRHCHHHRRHHLISARGAALVSKYWGSHCGTRAFFNSCFWLNTALMYLYLRIYIFVFIILYFCIWIHALRDPILLQLWQSTASGWIQSPCTSPACIVWIQCNTLYCIVRIHCNVLYSIVWIQVHSVNTMGHNWSSTATLFDRTNNAQSFAPLHGSRKDRLTIVPSWTFFPPAHISVEIDFSIFLENIWGKKSGDYVNAKNDESYDDDDDPCP